MKVATSDYVRTGGYLIMGGLLLIAGSVLVWYATTQVPAQGPPTNHDELREVLNNDRYRGALFGSGIALLTSGALMFLGFGCLEMIVMAVLRKLKSA
jgi:hypothetical protein